MSFQDPSRRQRQSRYPALAQYEDGNQSYQDYQSYQGYQAPQGSGSYQSYQGYQGYGSYQDYPGEQPYATAPPQRAPWDDPLEQPAAPEQPRRTSGPFFATSGDYPTRQDAVVDGRRGGLRRSRGLLAGGFVGFLSAALAIGVANLVAAFVRPQASPIIAVGEKFIDLTPPSLKNFAVQKFGENDKNMLLLGMYVTIALIAIGIGMLAWRRVAIGVAGIGLFGLLGAYIALTRPESHVTDMIPSLVGGIVGIAAIVWLVRMGMPRGQLARGRRRRTAWAGGNA